MAASAEDLTVDQRCRYATAFEVAAEFYPPMSLGEFIDYHLLADPELELRFWTAQVAVFRQLTAGVELSAPDRRAVWAAVEAVSEFAGRRVPPDGELRLPVALGVSPAELCGLFSEAFGAA